MFDQDLKKQGEDGERLFMDWLNKIKQPFLYISQGQHDFAVYLDKIGAKRPDFLILKPSGGQLVVDVKYHNIKFDEFGNKCFTINMDTEIEPAREFFNLTGFHLWYAFYPQNINNSPWFFINLDGVEKMGGKPQSGRYGKYFYLKLENFCIAMDNISNLDEYAVKIKMMTK
jgi:hypothetical protein